MLLRRFYDDKLAQASWLVGCAATGEALVVDPNRDAEQYVAAAQAEGLRVTHVTETHIHADYVSGSRELAQRTGARLLLSSEGGPEWAYRFAAEAEATLLADGDTFMVGNLALRALHTPGHTPEHLCFMLTDTPASDRAFGVFTGDFIFAGDVGRPDLLERAAKMEGTMRDAARALYASLQRFAGLPDYLQLWPGHGAGSACGKALGAVPSTTLGYEKVSGWAFRAASEEAFVEEVLAGQPEPPRYFAVMKRINRDGPRVLGAMPVPRRLPAGALRDVLDAGGIVVDLRPAAEHAQGHVPGTIGIPLNRSFTNWAGALLPYDRDIHLVTGGGDDRRGAAHEAVRDLALIGLDRVAGVFGADAIERWQQEGGELATVAQADATSVAESLERGEVTVLDVRRRSEWDEGHLPGVRNIPLSELQDRLDELPRDRPLVLQCQGGGRSAIAASLLQATGFPQEVRNLAGGYTAWARAGLPVERA